MFKYISDKSFLITLFFLIFSLYSKAQVNIIHNNEIIQRLEPEILSKVPNFFTSLKPYNDGDLKEIINIDSILSFDGNRKRSSWIGRKLFEESFFKVDSTNFSFTVDPLYNLSAGKEQGNSQKLINNTRGILVKCRIGKTIGIESSFYENQTFFPKVWDQFIDKYRVSPGQGRAKRYNKTGWDYAYSSGSITWKPHGIFMLQLGQGKNFVGNGYRSLLLSDVSTNYPFLRFSLTWKKFRYTRIIAGFQNLDYKINYTDIREFPKKTANFHLIDVMFLKYFQLSIFEGTILKNPDAEGKFKFNFDVINPIPFLQILDNGRKSSIAGINLNWRITPLFQVYNQWCFDKPLRKDTTHKMSLKKYGYQAGVKYFHAFNIKNLYFQVEYNKVRPFIYSQSDSTIAYTNFGQPLAHPLGANFYEIIGIANYRFKRFYISYQIVSSKYGDDNKTENNGKNIFKPQTQSSASFLAGIKTDIIIHRANLSMYINPATNSCISVGAYWRNQRSVMLNTNTKVLYISFSTNLQNLYNDF